MEFKEGSIVTLRHVAGRLCRPNAPNTGLWASLGTGWRGAFVDGTDRSDSRYHHKVHVIDADRGAYCYEPLAGGGIVGNDPTASGTDDVVGMVYYKPDGDLTAGFAETFYTYKGNAFGGITAQTEFGPGSGGDNGAFVGFPFVVELVQ